METAYLETVIMLNLNKIKGERTIYSIFHLLQGKRSSQTIQDAHLYQLTPFFQSFQPITRKWIEKVTMGLIEKDLAKETSESKVVLTGHGHSILEERLADVPLPKYLNGWKYHQNTDLFWERLTLLVQVCSNLVYRQRAYVPVSNKKETLKWIKSYLGSLGEDRDRLSARLFDELANALDNPGTRPDHVVARLTGAKQIGLTALQAAEMAGIEYPRYHFEFLDALHAMFDRIISDPGRYPLLYGLLGKTTFKSALTLSAEKTYRYLQKGYSLEEIAAIRNLKENTIEDHIVEIALSIEDFSIGTYLPYAKQKRILEAAEMATAKKLKQIREKVSDASYFEIRLALAKSGGAKWN